MLQPKDTGLLNGYKNKTHIYAVIQSEGIQKEKNKYGMLTHIYGIKKKWF